MFYSEILRELNQGYEYRWNLNVGQHNVTPEQIDTVARFQNVDEFLLFIKNKATEKQEPFEGIFV